MITIRTGVGMIPGGIQYQDPRTASANWTDTHTFLPDRARQVIKFRLANPKIYPERDWTQYHFVAQQITDYNAGRLKNDAQFFIDMPAVAWTPAPAPVPVERTCPKCHVALETKYCPTCAGKRVTGYKCPQCGEEFSK